MNTVLPFTATHFVASTNQPESTKPKQNSVQALAHVEKTLIPHTGGTEPLSDRHTLLSLAEKKINNIGKDTDLFPEKKVFFLEEVSALIKTQGYREGAKCLAQWPDHIKGQTWLQTLLGCLLDNPDSPLCELVIAELKSHANSTEAPIKAYLEVLTKLQEMNALKSPEGFQNFMDWLIRWKLSDSQPRDDLLALIPDDYRKMRGDFPMMSDSGIEMAEGCGWGWMNPIRDYLAHTQWLQHYMIFSLLEHAPLHFIESVINHWLNNDDTVDIREKLFTQTQHPLSVCFTEPRPWNLLLKAVERLAPQQDSKLRQELTQRDGSGLIPEAINNRHLVPFQAPNKPFIFGRTVAAINSAPVDTVDATHPQENTYLKIQSHNESDQQFFKEAQRIQYFHDNQLKSELKGPALRLDAVLNTHTLKETLSQCALTDTEKAQLLLRCSKKRPNSHLYEALKNDWGDDCEAASSRAKRTHWHTLLEDDSLLPETKKQKLITHLLSIDTGANMMLLRSPADYHYETYIDQVEDPAVRLAGIAHYLEEFGSLWFKGVLGPDACSAFHDAGHRIYHFLAPFFYHDNVGSIELWSGASTDFPNIGPEGSRDRGDAKTTSELNTKELFGQPGTPENPNTLRTKAAQEALAKAAWGGLLLYGRCFRNNFNPDCPESVSTIKEDIHHLLGTLFSKAFNMSSEECSRLMNEHDLLNQTAREMSYWMSHHYVKDLREGLIPESVYPYYQGVRGPHKLAPHQADYLSDDGFKGGQESIQLGAETGRNPLMALDALVVKFLSYGCLELRRPM